MNHSSIQSQREIEVGQIIYVSRSFQFQEKGPNLSEFIVNRVTEDYFCAVEKNIRFHVEYQFDRETNSYITDMFKMKAYFDEDDYWNQPEVKNVKGELLNEIAERLASANVDRLIEIKNILDN